MIRRILFAFCLLCIPAYSYAESDAVYDVEEYLARKPNSTECATKIFNNALRDTAHMIESSEDASSTEIETWTHFAFSQPDVLSAVLKCPELNNLQDDDTIVFETVSYTFPASASYPQGRLIQINYETQKKVLKQRLLLADKHQIDGDNISPDIAQDAANGIVWVNVDPAWYGILVAEHGTLDKFVGPNKKNILSLDYIEQNIGTLYPKDHNPIFHANCTSKTAWAEDIDMVNRAVAITVGGRPARRLNPNLTEEEKQQQKKAKQNDYYVMGDGNLQWITYLEVVADVVLSVATWGGFEVVKGTLLAARAARVYRKARVVLNNLRSSAEVAKWIKVSGRATDIERAIKTADNIDDTFRAISKIEKSTTQNVKSLESKLKLLRSQDTDPKIIKTLEQELEVATKQSNAAKEAFASAERMKELEQTLKNPVTTNPKEIEKLQQELYQLKNGYSTQLTKLKGTHADELAKLEKNADVKTYKSTAQAQREAAHTVYLMRQGKRALQAKRGLLPVRTVRAWKELRKGIKSAKNLDKSAKLVRANTSGISSKINDWLFHNTLKHISAISKVPAQLETLKLFVKVVGGMYDWTETETSDFTNNIPMKPYLLLGADDLEGYEDVVNKGMWLFWTGSSTSSTDDDAAFLQAMSFAERFHQDLVEIQDEYNVMSCDVDIYVVRPIIRNPGTEEASLYYLFMNETPWTTHGYNVPNDGSEPAGIALRSSDGANNYSMNGNGNELANNNGNQNIEYYTPTLNEDGSVTRYSKGIGYYTEPRYDGTRVGLPCTKPSTKAGGFTKDVLTSGRYAQISPAFEKAMITKFRTEGGCGSHPADRCGYTCYGVCSRYFPQVKSPTFSRQDAEDIAWNVFFKGHNLDKLPDAISGDVFMALWGTGSKPFAIGTLQKLLGVKKTNVVDQATIEAAMNYTGPDLREQYLKVRERSFMNGQQVFRKGWLNGLEVYRANGCHTIAE